MVPWARWSILLFVLSLSVFMKRYPLTKLVITARLSNEFDKFVLFTIGDVLSGLQIGNDTSPPTARPDHPAFTSLRQTP